MDRRERDLLGRLQREGDGPVWSAIPTLDGHLDIDGDDRFVLEGRDEREKGRVRYTVSHPEIEGLFKVDAALDEVIAEVDFSGAPGMWIERVLQ